MVGQLHPVPFITRAIPTLPLANLALLAWEMHRGVGKAHFEKCPVCQHVGEWCIDEMWKKWKHDEYQSFHLFIYRLIKKSTFYNFSNNVTNENLKHFNVYFEGWTPGLISIM